MEITIKINIYKKKNMNKNFITSNKVIQVATISRYLEKKRK